MARLIVLILLAAIVVGAVLYVWSRIAGRPLVNDTLGKVLVALTLAGLALWLFGGGALFGEW
ncbi:hypothetical protein FQ775_22260 [Nitratireductor mangrovi]|uniref:Uncharacterized protein n=1 Tax=Nitratireductor mangrovi TaxID=2599600 RepID=A0A5B8L4C9_9HYPH|nr:hypothetical protein [Nitratireductor mangrovi]QDZ02871.1 hypothetical protein FQ775_22260 [Nitratireductor mangrovi]